MIYLVCKDDGKVIDIIKPVEDETPKEVFDYTIASNYGEWLIELTNENVKDIIQLALSKEVK